MCEGTGNATLTYDNGIVVLTAVKFKTCDVVVYRLDESSHEYNRVSAVIEGILEEYNTENCEFKDAWETLLTALEDFKIVDEMLNP